MMGGGPGQQQLQELSQQLQEIQEQIKALEGEIDRLEAEQVEIDEATEAIETLKSGSTVQVPLGGDAYVRAEIQEIDEVIVGLGGGYAAEQEQDHAIDTLEAKRETVDDRIDEINVSIDQLENESSNIEEKAQQLQQQQMQQQMQQMQGDADEQ